MFWGVCISNATSECDVYTSCFLLFCIFGCLLCKTLEYMKLFKNQIQVYQNTKKKPVLEILRELKRITFSVVCSWDCEQA